MTDDDVLRGGAGGGAGEDYEWEGAPDLTSSSEEDLRVLLRDLSEEERAISYRRRVLQGRIDLIRAELVRRGGASLSPEDLARVLLDRGGGDPDPEGPSPEGRG